MIGACSELARDGMNHRYLTVVLQRRVHSARLHGGRTGRRPGTYSTVLKIAQMMGAMEGVLMGCCFDRLRSMRHTITCIMCFTLMAQDSTTEHIKDFVQWRNANLGFRSQEEQLREYRAKLIASNIGEKAADAIILDLVQHVDRLRAARWDLSLLDPAYPMNRAPNRLLADVVKGKKPGSALDIGAGQGRNSFYLAKLGWSVTAFDEAEKALNDVRQKAADAKLPLQAVFASFDRFEYGSERWDLVVDMYEFVPVRKYRQRIYESLKHGGLWVIEGFGSQSAAPGNARGEGPYGSGELLRILAEQFRILKYEEVDDIGDFGLQVEPLVRVVAQKK